MGEGEKGRMVNVRNGVIIILMCTERLVPKSEGISVRSVGNIIYPSVIEEH